MNERFSIVALSCIALFPAGAQEQPAPAAQPVAEAAAPAAEQPQLPAGEERIRTGILMLAGLHETLAKVQDKESAEAAAPFVMRFITQLQNWGHSFNSLPPLDEETQQRYEERYLPIIARLNSRLQAQADRIASAEYYGSRNLPAALIQLVANFQ